MLIGSDGIGYTLGKHRISISFNHFLEIPHLAFGIYYIKNDDDKENELYYILKLLGIKTVRNVHDTSSTKHNIELTFDLGANKNNFVDLDGFRRRICGYRFALESLIENGTVYQDRFLQTKYLEIVLANIVRRKLEDRLPQKQL